jgi:hypothetical protein
VALGVGTSGSDPPTWGRAGWDRGRSGPRGGRVEEVVAVPIWLMLTLVIGGCIVLGLTITYAWSKWMTRPGAPED